MKANPGRGSSHTSGDRPAHVQGSGNARSITVHCPTRECGKVYTVESRYVGKRGKCQECGTIIPIRASEETSRESSKANSEADAQRDERPKSGHADVRGVRVGCIGRGHAGKTALFHALGE